jgi:hypothetical protein
MVLVATSGGSRSPAVDLRGVDWENASVPAAICGGEGAIRLHEGVAIVSSRRWTDDWQGPATTEVPGQVEVWSYGDEVYGDIDGDGRDEAVVPLWCTNGGGTGGGQLGHGLAIMSGVAGKVSSLGIARTAQDPRGRPRAIVRQFNHSDC